jgi:hypothetical protein
MRWKPVLDCAWTGFGVAAGLVLAVDVAMAALGNAV